MAQGMSGLSHTTDNSVHPRTGGVQGKVRARREEEAADMEAVAANNAGGTQW